MKHALQLEASDFGLEALGVFVDVAGGGLVTFAFGEIEELGGVGDSLGGAVELFGVGGQPRSLASELLRALGFGPDGGVFELAAYLFETFLLEVVLKETPVRSGCARRDL